MIWLRQSTASQEIPLGYFVDSTDGDTEETALTIANTDIKLWKTGATTLANKNSGGGTHISNGIYYATLDATDTNTLGPMVVFVHVSGALTVRLECLVLPANVYDSLVAGTDTLQADVQQWIGTAPLALTSQLVQAQANQLGAQGKLDVNAEVDSALDTAVPGTPTAGSINERIKTMDDADMPNSLSTLLGRITATLFSGITSLAEWLGLIAGKQTGDTTARTELRATGAGSGTYDETTDSQEAIRDTAPLGTAMRGTDSAATATALATAQADLDLLTGSDGATLATSQPNYAPNKTAPLDAAGVRTAVGLASANLDTQISAVKTDTASILTDTADMQPKLGTPAGTDMSADIAAVKTDTAAIKAKTDNLPDGITKNAALTYTITMTDSTNHQPAASLTVTFQRSLDGGALASASGTVTEISNGLYKVAAAAADMNGDTVTHRFSATGADDLSVEFKTEA